MPTEIIAGAVEIFEKFLIVPKTDGDFAVKIIPLAMEGFEFFTRFDRLG